MKTEILKHLKGIEKERDIKIIYACESGSRAWGFESPNSDWDIRFIYKYPIDKYLGINKPKDAFDFHLQDNDLDFGGWDVKKSAGLLRNYNASLVEWLNSPVVYLETEHSRKLKKISSQYFNKKAALWHYVSLASGVYKKYIEKREVFPLKKVLYVIRPLFCAEWIHQKDNQPPTDFNKILSNDLGISIIDYTKELVEKKKGIKEMDKITTNNFDPSVLKWIESQIYINKLRAQASKSSDINIDPLNSWCKDVIKSN